MQYSVRRTIAAGFAGGLALFWARFSRLPSSAGRDAVKRAFSSIQPRKIRKSLPSGRKSSHCPA